MSARIAPGASRLELLGGVGAASGGDAAGLGRAAKRRASSRLEWPRLAIASEIARRRAPAASSEATRPPPAFVHIRGLPEAGYDRRTGDDGEGKIDALRALISSQTTSHTGMYFGQLFPHLWPIRTLE